MGGEALKGVMRAVPVAMVKEERMAFYALVGVGRGVSVGLLAEGGLDEALGLAIRLRSKRSGEAVLDIEGGDGEAQGVGGAEAALGGSFEGLNGQAIGEVALHPMRKFWSGCGVGGDDFRKAASRPDLNATDFFAGLGDTELVGLA